MTIISQDPATPVRSASRQNADRRDENDAEILWLKSVIPLITSICRRHFPNIYEDCVQEVLLRVSQNLENLHNVKKREAWINRVTQNVCATFATTGHFRRWQRVKALADGVEIHDNQVGFPEKEWEHARDRIAEVIRGLPEQENTVAHLMLEGYTDRALATELGISNSQVKRLKKNVRRSLAERLGLAWRKRRRPSIVRPVKPSES